MLPPRAPGRPASQAAARPQDAVVATLLPARGARPQAAWSRPRPRARAPPPRPQHCPPWLAWLPPAPGSGPGGRNRALRLQLDLMAWGEDAPEAAAEADADADARYDEIAAEDAQRRAALQLGGATASECFEKLLSAWLSGGSGSSEASSSSPASSCSAASSRSASPASSAASSPMPRGKSTSTSSSRCSGSDESPSATLSRTGSLAGSPCSPDEEASGDGKKYEEIAQVDEERRLSDSSGASASWTIAVPTRPAPAAPSPAPGSEPSSPQEEHFADFDELFGARKL